MLLAPCMSLVSTSILYRSMDTLPSGNWLEVVDLVTFWLRSFSSPICELLITFKRMIFIRKTSTFVLESLNICCASLRSFRSCLLFGLVYIVIMVSAPDLTLCSMASCFSRFWIWAFFLCAGGEPGSWRVCVSAYHCVHKHGINIAHTHTHTRYLFKVTYTLKSHCIQLLLTTFTNIERSLLGNGRQKITAPYPIN